jgi:hypothetical protein
MYFVNGKNILKWPYFKEETKTFYVIMKMITGFEQR